MLEGVIGSEVLPGLQFRLEEMERQPRMEELALNDVYSGYVIPRLQVAVTESEAEAQRADAEATARQAERSNTASGGGGCGAPGGGCNEPSRRKLRARQAEATARQAAEQRAEEEAAARQAETTARQAAEQRAEEAEAAARGGGSCGAPGSRRADAGDGRGVGPAAAAVLLNAWSRAIFSGTARLQVIASPKNPFGRGACGPEIAPKRRPCRLELRLPFRGLTV